MHFYDDPLGVVKWNFSYIYMKYVVLQLYNNILKSNFTRAKLDFRKQSGSLSVGPVTDENDLMFPVPMSKAIFKLNHSCDSDICRF